MPDTSPPPVAGGEQRHAVRLAADTPLRIPGDKGVQINLEALAGRPRAIVLSRTTEQDGTRRCEGLEYRIDVLAHDAVSALARAKVAAEWINNSLATVTAGAIALREDALVICTEETVSSRELLQILDNVPTGRPVSRAVDVDLLARFASALNGIGKHDSERVHRAMWHLRKSAGTLDLVETFAELWMGLESINKSVREKHGLRTTTIVRRCTNCDAPMETEASTGITFAITTLAGGSDDDVRDARQFRKRLQHGARDVMSLAPTLTRLSDLMRRALIFAVADVIGFPESERSALVRAPYAIGESRGTITLRTWLRSNIDASQLLLGPDPPQFALALSLEGSKSAIKLVNFDGEAGPTELSLSYYNDPEAPKAEQPWRIIDNRNRPSSSDEIG